MAAVLNSVKETLFKLSKNYLGQDRAKKLLRADFDPVKTLRSKKRGRLHLKDVMKKDGAKVAAAEANGISKRVTRSESRKSAVEETEQPESESDAEDIADIAYNEIDAVNHDSTDIVAPVDVEEDGDDAEEHGIVYNGDVVKQVVEELEIVRDDDREVAVQDDEDGENDDDDDDDDDGEELAGFEIYESDENEGMDEDEFL